MEKVMVLHEWQSREEQNGKTTLPPGT